MSYSQRTMNGEDLFFYYTGLSDEYSQVLNTAFMQIGEELFPLLEQCHKEGKKIVLVDDPVFEGVDDQPFIIEMK